MENRFLHCSQLDKKANEHFFFTAQFSLSIFNKRTDFVCEKAVKMSSKRRQFQNHSDKFCYVCGNCMLVKYLFNVKDFTKRVYKAYFRIKIRDQDKPWVPHKVCKQCIETLRRWTQGKATSMQFGVPVVWREPKNHH